MSELTSMAHLKRYICDDSHFKTLESILEEKLEEYHELEALEETLEFGERLTPQKVKQLVPQVEEEVQNFLGVTNIPSVKYSVFYWPHTIAKTVVTTGVAALPAYVLTTYMSDPHMVRDGIIAGVFGFFVGSYFLWHDKEDHKSSCYMPHSLTKIMYKGKISLADSLPLVKDKITLSEKEEVSAVGGIAHEYTHHIQYHMTALFSELARVKAIMNYDTRMVEKGVDILKRWEYPISEGHARGVEGKICYKFAEKYGNKAYLLDYLDSVVSELQDAYFFACKRKGVKPKENLEKLVVKESMLDRLSAKAFSHHYPIGVAAFAIAEKKHGEKIYQDVLKEEYLFLKM